MLDPLLRDLLELKVLAYQLVSKTQVGEESETVMVRAADLAALVRQLTQVAAHGDTEAAWRMSSGGQIAQLRPTYGPRRRTLE